VVFEYELDWWSLVGFAPLVEWAGTRSNGGLWLDLPSNCCLLLVEVREPVSANVDAGGGVF
jgi:hypothetical protein